MKKITIIGVVLLLITQLTFSQNTYKRIVVKNSSQSTLKQLMQIGIDLHCGAVFKANGVQLEISDEEIKKIDELGISYTVEVEDITAFYKERAIRDLPNAKNDLILKHSKTKRNKKDGHDHKSVSSITLDNYLQHTGSSEVNWATPANFNLGSMGGCFTLSEMKTELDDMRTYSVNNGLNIVSIKQDASSTGVTTWGNPASTTTNNGLTYTGQGTSRWNPDTIYYVRITGNHSGTPENTKPQMLFTSMIHSREVSALMNNIYFMWYLIENYNTDSAIKELVDNNELYFIPVVNPDGLRWNEHLSPTGGAFQRKNLRPNTGGTANNSNNRGVDLNRNFDYFWGYNNIGSSGIETSGTYRGNAPESEPETKILVDFINNRNIKSGVWNHSYANSVPHPYGGVPTQSTGREDEYYRWHEEMTRYNRYLYGATIFYESNGLPDDWMMGGAPDNNGSSGSGQGIIATTPEHGGDGFWPTPSTIVPIAQKSMRISLGTIYYGGKYGKLHDLTQSNITSLTSDLDFGIERVGQTGSDFMVTVTPVSSNISSITSPPTQTGMAVLQQRKVTANLVLNSGIAANEKIEYNVKLSNNDGIIYDINFEKYYQPNVLFNHNPDVNGLTGWTQSGGWNNTSSDAYSASNSLSTGTYSNDTTKTLTTTNSYDFSNSNEVLVQFYSKWDIERNYDFVEVLGSPDGGSNWISLGGNYTKPNATSATTSHDNKSNTYSDFQANSSGQIYDGDRMDNWVMEEIVINQSNYISLLNSNNVKIRFNFRTDALNVSENYTTTSDGFFIDDFKIIGVSIPCETSVPSNVTTTAITATTASVSWDIVPSATYDLRYREVDSGTWIDILDLSTANYNLNGLTTLTNYEVQIRSKCSSSNSAYTTSSTFSTIAIVYCDSEGNNSGANDEYIGNVTLKTINHTTGNDQYSDYTAQSTDVILNETVTLSITPIWGSTKYNEGYSVWIDYNKDGDFNDAGEQVWTQAPTQTTPVIGNFTIPGTATLGPTRIRVSMKYNMLPTSCESYEYGEVEDYTVNIISNLATWYEDLDSDSFGNPFISQSAASQPAGYVIDNTDCDDNNADEFPGQTWYIGVDNDADTFFGSVTSTTACEQPAGYSINAPAITDCDDNDADEFPGQTWYTGVDNDADTFFGNVNTITACEQPAGYSINAPAITDCDDNDATIYPGATEVINDNIDQDCDGSDETTLEIDNQDTNQVMVTPNPFKSNVNIKLPSNFIKSDFNIKIYDLNGRLIIDRIYSSLNNQVKVTGLEKLDQAPYIFKIVNTISGVTIYKRLIKN